VLVPPRFSAGASQLKVTLEPFTEADCDSPQLMTEVCVPTFITCTLAESPVPEVEVSATLAVKDAPAFTDVGRVAFAVIADGVVEGEVVGVLDDPEHPYTRSAHTETRAGTAWPLTEPIMRVSSESLKIL
jgi:hypothetical protein